MKKEERLQIRVEAKQLKFLREYSEKKNITISVTVRDFIDWLMKKERRDNEDTDGTQGTS